MTIRVVPGKEFAALLLVIGLREGNPQGYELLQKAFGGHRRWASIYPFSEGKI